MKFKHIIFIFLSFVLGFFSGNAIKFLYEVTTFKPWGWKDNPVVVNCYGDDFNEGQLVRGIDYWSVRGHNIAFYEMNPSKNICENEYLDGFIILRKAPPNKYDSELLAVTSRWTAGLYMEGAVIWFKPGTQNLELIIEHELGHAFGYGHVEIEDHLMHPEYEKMSGKFWIP